MQNQSIPDLRQALAGIIAFVPAFIAGLVVLLLGLLAWWVVARVVGRLLVLSRLDRLAVRMRWGRALSKGDVRHALFDLVGTVIGAFVFLLFLDNALQLWHLTVLVRLLEGLVLLVPQLVVAAIVVIVGLGVGAMAERAARRTFSEAGVPHALLLARTFRTAVVVLASAIALVELNLATQLVSQAFLIAFGCLGLAFVLAVGLGSRRAVERMWEDLLDRHHLEQSILGPGPDVPAALEPEPFERQGVTATSERP